VPTVAGNKTTVGIKQSFPSQGYEGKGRERRREMRLNEALKLLGVREKVLKSYLIKEAWGDLRKAEIKVADFKELDLNVIPYENTHTGSLGDSVDFCHFLLIYSEDIIQIPYNEIHRSNYAHDQEWEDKDGITIKEAIEKDGFPLAILQVEHELEDWPGSEYVNEWNFILYKISSFDNEKIKKIRRRVEDRLRKSSTEDILRTAIALDVKID